MTISKAVAAKKASIKKAAAKKAPVKKDAAEKGSIKPAPRALTPQEAAAYRRIYMANRDKVTGYLLELKHGLVRPAYWVGFKFEYKGTKFMFTCNRPFSALPTMEDIGMAIKFARKEIMPENLILSLPYTLTTLPKERSDELDQAAAKVNKAYREHCKSVLVYSNFVKANSPFSMYQHAGSGFLAANFRETTFDFELSKDNKSISFGTVAVNVITDNDLSKYKFFAGFVGSDVVRVLFPEDKHEIRNMAVAAVSFERGYMADCSAVMNKFLTVLGKLEKKGSK